jgi:hypothetical protein
MTIIEERNSEGNILIGAIGKYGQLPKVIKFF